MKTDYDVITVGGGLGGAALAKVLAENGKRVLVVEREAQFKDRIRGEFMQPWGVAELPKVGLYETLLQRCANEQPFLHLLGTGPARDLRVTTPQRLPAWTFFHPTMQEVVLDAAGAAGAEIRRGATVREVRLGTSPTLIIDRDGQVLELSARLIVAADGRSSSARSWGGFTAKRASQKLLGAGVMLEGLNVQADTASFFINPFAGRAGFFFPQDTHRSRAYLTYGDDLRRLQGDADGPRFIEESLKMGMPAELYQGARPVGPLASFDMTETWVDHPYRDGLALIGDAAGSTDPTWGQGLSLTSRDARVLAEELLASEDWDAAAHRYADKHDAYFYVTRIVGEWQFDFFLGRGPQADERRMRTFPLIMSEPERVPDHLASGPELLFNDDVRRRFYGEI